MAALSFQGAPCFSRSGLGFKCRFPMPCAVASGSINVRTGGMAAACTTMSFVSGHPFTGCAFDSGPLYPGSVKTFINGGGAGRIGDQIGLDNTVVMGNPTVFVI